MSETIKIKHKSRCSKTAITVEIKGRKKIHVITNLLIGDQNLNFNALQIVSVFSLLQSLDMTNADTNK